MNSNKKIEQLLNESKERLKELKCINQTTAIIKENKSVEETLKHIVLILPDGWQYPENTSARIEYEGKYYDSNHYEESEWNMKQGFSCIDGSEGKISVFYNTKFPDLDEGPFLDEERDLINNLANLISGYINSVKARQFVVKEDKSRKSQEGTDRDSSDNLRLMTRFISKHNSDRDIYHDLMPFKVKEILLVANLYDAYIIEKEGRFTEYILGEYYHLNLTSTPRITGVSTGLEAMELLRNKHFDLVIIMIGIDKKSPIELSRQIKSEFQYIPVYMLLNNNSDIALFREKPELTRFIDKQFVWNGDSKIFFTMLKHLEDKINVENDTEIGMVRVILLVEDSAKYYSRYLPLLYQIILEQTKLLIEETTVDELYKILKLRVRPKILLATNYEEAIASYEKYKNNLLCVISDVSFPKNGLCNDCAGLNLIHYIKQNTPELPLVLQSSDEENAKKAFEYNVTFINKNSESLSQDIKSFIKHYLGFGNFVYRDKNGRQIVIAKSLREFEKNLENIPAESLLYHGQRNHFSLWLMARGEIQIAKNISSFKIVDFNDAEEVRKFLITNINIHRNEQNKGKVVPFEDQALEDERNIVSLASGALGGKGRGVAFINTLIYNFDLSEMFPEINITCPKTSIIGTDEFDIFIERNKLMPIILEEQDYEVLKQKFVTASLSNSLIKNLKALLKKTNRPLAVRSSSLMEDSLMQPFAGIFSTYLLPNNHQDNDKRLEQLMSAIKLVFASIYSPGSRTYFDAVNYKIESEKMAIVIQEVVGNQHENTYYPHISGTAQSHNYYPIAHMKPDEGFAVLAVGLGTYVVEGEKTYRFAPKYPNTEINTQKDIYKTSQVEFYAIDLSNPDVNLMEGEDAGLSRIEITEARKHGTIKHCASVYDAENDTITPGLEKYGPIVINFANILKYEYIPLAKTIIDILDIIKEALGSPVEIEFAVDLNKDKNRNASFHLLQIKPLVGSDDDFNINEDNINKDEVILLSEKSMGNGKITDVQDMIFVDPNMFDNMKTKEIAAEIERMNRKMMKENKKYILIGPGRWGTRDPFIGIPVIWPQICNAKIIIEMSLESFPLDASLGSHFFHNVTSMNVGYFTVQHRGSNDIINWEVINNQELIEKTKFLKHIRFKKNINIIMDGKKRLSVISFEDKNLIEDNLTSLLIMNK
jgi:hypothetical protein